jgi:glutathione S-transferase
MSVKFYYASGSPYAWRVWLALERKGIPYHLKTLSFDAGDLRTPEFGALNPRRRVPVLVDDDFVIYESSTVVEYIEDRWPDGPALFANEPRMRAMQRRMVCEADQYLAPVGTRFATTPSEEGAKDLKQELALWEGAATSDYLAGELSAVDLTVYPFMALFLRIAGRRSDFAKDAFVGPRLSTWMDRMQALPIVQHTRPPHWK